jgi:hypothetical protein
MKGGWEVLAGKIGKGGRGNGRAEKRRLRGIGGARELAAVGVQGGAASGSAASSGYTA